MRAATTKTPTITGKAIIPLDIFEGIFPTPVAKGMPRLSVVVVVVLVLVDVIIEEVAVAYLRREDKDMLAMIFPESLQVLGRIFNELRPTAAVDTRDGGGRLHCH